MPLGATTRRFANQSVQVERNVGSFDRGRYGEEADPELFEIMANVQPAPPETISRLPEGSRAMGSKVIYPRAGDRELRTAAAGDKGHNADRVTIDDQVYEIASVEPWRQHRRYVATRFGQ